LLAATLAVGVVVVVLTSMASTDTGELAAAAAKPPSAPVPGSADELRLAVTSDGIAFPDWQPRLGWRATGVRRDDLDGRRAVTVTYERDGREVAYAILGRPALDLPDGTRPYRALDHEGRNAVAWVHEGRTCLLLGDPRVSTATLRRLAASVRFY
jgi:hypothetical protein